MKSRWTLLLTCLAIIGTASAQDTDILQKAINKPGLSYNIYGPADHKIIKDKTVQGGQAVRVKIPKAGPDNWTVGAQSAIEKPIADADVLMIAFWARAPELKDGETTPLPFVGVGLAQAPYTQIISGTVDVTNQWKLHMVRGRASGNFAAGTTNAGLHLAANKAVIDLGPIFVLDLGPKP
ncbi:MAG TPA: hypothetical protein VKB34_16950 [Povalibacter sp.]|nr:hypothetical protein [Povalibacter sp.]